MFKFKTMRSLNKKNIKKLNFANKKPTKAMPEWWADTSDHCMVEGTLKYGWGNIPAQFTPTYKGVKKVKKAKKNSKQQQADWCGHCIGYDQYYDEHKCSTKCDCHTCTRI
eukprot:583555_1